MDTKQTPPPLTSTLDELRGDETLSLPETTLRTSASLRLELVNAIAVPNSTALLIGADNQRIGQTSITAAVMWDAVFCVQVQDEVLVLDVDRPDCAQWLWQISHDLQQKGMSPVVIESGGVGRLHLFCRLPDVELRKRIRCDARASEIDPRDTGGDRIRPPLTRHRSGLLPRLVIPGSAQEALAALQPPTSATVPEVGDKPRLTKRTWSLLRWGVPGGNQSQVTWRIACGAAAIGYQPDQLFHLLLRPENVGGLGLRDRISRRGEESGRRWFYDAIWKQAVRWVAENPTLQSRPEVIEAIVLMQQEIAQYEWNKVVLDDEEGKSQTVSGKSVRRLLSFIVDLALDNSTITPHLGGRFVQEHLGMDPKIFRKAIRALQALGWISLERPNTRTKATTYRLLLNHPRKNPPHLSPLRGCRDYGGSLRVEHPVFQAGSGIGEVGRRLLLQLDESEGSSVKELVSLVDCSNDTARRVLKKIRAAWVDQAGGWCLVH